MDRGETSSSERRDEWRIVRRTRPVKRNEEVSNPGQVPPEAVKVTSRRRPLLSSIGGRPSLFA